MRCNEFLSMWSQNTFSETILDPNINVEFCVQHMCMSVCDLVTQLLFKDACVWGADFVRSQIVTHSLGITKVL